jgi:hypothetical protein
MAGTAPLGVVDRVRRHLVQLTMPRALDAFDGTLCSVEQGELSALADLEQLPGEELTMRETQRIKIALMTGGSRVDARIEVTAVMDRKTIRRSFRLPLEGGMRLKLSNVLSQRTLGVSRIDKLLGPARDVKIITSRR